METEFLYQVGNSSLDVILYAVILQRGNVLVGFRSYLSTGAVFVHSVFLISCLSFLTFVFLLYMDHPCYCM
jgi:hypothetical protein